MPRLAEPSWLSAFSGSLISNGGFSIGKCLVSTQEIALPYDVSVELVNCKTNSQGTNSMLVSPEAVQNQLPNG